MIIKIQIHDLSIDWTLEKLKDPNFFLTLTERSNSNYKTSFKQMSSNIGHVFHKNRLNALDCINLMNIVWLFIANTSLMLLFKYCTFNSNMFSNQSSPIFKFTTYFNFNVRGCQIIIVKSWIHWSIFKD